MLASFDEESFIDRVIDDENETILSNSDLAAQIRDILIDQFSEAVHAEKDELASIWREIGLPSSVTLGRMHEIGKLCAQLVVEAKEADLQARTKLRTYKQDIFEQINEMLSALHEPSYQAPTDISLLNVCKIMKRKYKELKSIKNERMAELLRLLDQRDKLSDVIAEETPQFKTETAIPSQQELCQLQSIVEKLQTEKTRRLNRFRDLRQSILIFVDQLGYKPKNNLETVVFAGDESKYILSQASITQLLKLNTELEKKVAENTKTKDQLLKRLEYLWDLLEICVAEREAILSDYSSITDDCIERLKKDQLKKYENQRSERLVEFIANIEPRVQDWWARCFISDDEITNFRARLSCHSPGSEELLKAWEVELDRLQSLYNDNKDTFTAVEKWHELLDELEELYNQANDPEVYKNRRLPSTYFMNLSKKKKSCETKIAKIEAQLEACTQVTIDGRSFADYIFSYRDSLEFLKKENQKATKKAERVPISNVCKNKSGSTNSSSTSIGKRNRLVTATPEHSSIPNKMSRPLVRSGTITKMKCPTSNERPVSRITSQVSLGTHKTGPTESVLSIDSEEIFKTNLNGRKDVNSTFKPVSSTINGRSKSSPYLPSPIPCSALAPSSGSPPSNLRRPDYRRPFRL